MERLGVQCLSCQRTTCPVGNDAGEGGITLRGELK